MSEERAEENPPVEEGQGPPEGEQVQEEVGEGGGAAQSKADPEPEAATAAEPAPTCPQPPYSEDFNPFTDDGTCYNCIYIHAQNRLYFLPKVYLRTTPIHYSQEQRATVNGRVGVYRYTYIYTIHDCTLTHTCVAWLALGVYMRAAVHTDDEYWRHPAVY